MFRLMFALKIVMRHSPVETYPPTQKATVFETADECVGAPPESGRDVGENLIAETSACPFTIRIP